MSATLPQPLHPDPAIQLQHDLCDAAAEDLRDALPPPRTDTQTDTQEAWARRNRVALATVLSLGPASPVELDLAICHVGAIAHVKESLRQAARHMDDLNVTRHHRAEAACMGREGRGYLGKLESLQKAHRKHEATRASPEGTAMTEQSMPSLMTDAMERLPPVPPADAPSERAAAGDAATPAESASALPRKPAPPQVYSEWSDEEKQLDRIRWEADQYAVHHTMRVQAIRKLGGLPPDCDYEPPPPEVLHAIINLDGPVMRFADTYVPWVPPES